MLGIKNKNGKNDWIEWHVNESVPDIDGPVITFQADGHELELILRAMEEGFDYNPRIPRCPCCRSYSLTCIGGHVWDIPSGTK